MYFLLSTRDPRDDGRAAAAPRFGLASDQQAWSQVDPDEWTDSILDAAGSAGVLFHVHGFNLDHAQVLARHEGLQQRLRRLGFRDALVGFDWPAVGRTAEYWTDRDTALRVCTALLTDGLGRLRARAPALRAGVLAHSMGTFVTVNAFTEAAKAGALDPRLHRLDEVMLFAADIRFDRMARNQPFSRAFFKQARRVTVYYSGADDVLTGSEFLRGWLGRLVGFRGRDADKRDRETARDMRTWPRLGRVGLPHPWPGRTVNIACDKRFNTWRGTEAGRRAGGLRSHSFYYLDEVFLRDVVGVWHGTERWGRTRGAPTVQAFDFDLLPVPGPSP